MEFRGLGDFLEIMSNYSLLQKKWRADLIQ